MRTVNLIMIPSASEPDYAESGEAESRRPQETTMATVWIPPLLRDLAEGRESLRVNGTTVREVLDELERHCPGIKARICEGDLLRSGIAIVINADVARQGLGEPVSDRDEVHFVQAIAGG